MRTVPTYRELLFQITQIADLQGLLTLQSELISCHSNWQDYFFRHKHLLFEIEAKRLELRAEKSFSGEMIVPLCNQVQRIFQDMLNDQHPHPSDDPQLKILSTELQLITAKFQMHILRSNSQIPHKKTEDGIHVPGLSFNDLLDQCWQLHGEIIKPCLWGDDESMPTISAILKIGDLFHESLHQVHHSAQDDQLYFSSFESEALDLLHWEIYRIDQEFMTLLEWAYQKLEKNSEISQHFLYLLMQRRYFFSKPAEVIAVLQKIPLRHIPIGYAKNERDCFQIFSKQFESQVKRLSAQSILSRIADKKNGVDEEYLALIREVFLLEHQYVNWSTAFLFKSNEEELEENVLFNTQILTTRALLKVVTALHLSRAKIEMINILPSDRIFEMAIINLKEYPNLQFNELIHLDLLLSAVLHIWIHDVARLIQTQNIQRFAFMVETPAILEKFEHPQDRDFFLSISSVFRNCIEWRLGISKNKIELMQAFKNPEYKLIGDFFLKYAQFQVNQTKEKLKNLFLSYANFANFLSANKGPHLLCLAGLIHSLFADIHRLKRSLLEGLKAARDGVFLRRVDESIQSLRATCKTLLATPEPVVVARKKEPKKIEVKSTPPKNGKPDSTALRGELTQAYSKAETLTQKADILTKLIEIYYKEYKKNKAKNLPKIRKWSNEFFNLVLSSGLEMKALRVSIGMILGILKPIKDLIFSENPAFQDNAKNIVATFFREFSLSDFQNDDLIYRAILMLRLLDEFQLIRFQEEKSAIFESIQKWGEACVNLIMTEKIPNTECSRSILEIFPILDRLKIASFSRNFSTDPSFFASDKNASAVLKFFEDKCPVFIYGGAPRDMLIEENRGKNAQGGRVRPNDLDIYVDLGQEALWSLLREGFGDVYRSIVDNKNYHFKVKFPDGSEVDVNSLREDRSEPIIFALFRKAMGFNFSINRLFYSVKDHILYSFSNAFECIKTSQFPYLDDFNQHLPSFSNPKAKNPDCDHPKHIYQAMDLLAKHLSHSVVFSLSDQERFFQKLEALKSRCADRGTPRSDLTEDEKRQVNNVALKLFCLGHALSSFRVCMEHHAFTILFPSLLKLVSTVAGREYIEKCCTKADETFNQNKRALKSAAFYLRMGYLLSMFFYQPIFENGGPIEIQPALSSHIQACLFWIARSTESVVRTNFEKVRRGNGLDIFSLAEISLKAEHQKKSLQNEGIFYPPAVNALVVPL